MPKANGERKVEPIPASQRKEWNALIKETIEVVERRDSTQFDLIILAGKVVGSYGEDRIGRWADDAHVSREAAKQYRWLSRAGVDEEFIKKWVKSKENPRGLSYSVIRTIAGFCGNLKSEYALEYLAWAVEHKASAIATKGYMMESVAPTEHRDEAAKAIKMALQDKQEHEGFSDFMKIELEKIAEARPDLEDQILGTVITNEKDLTELKIAAGIINKEEQRIAEESLKSLEKIKRFRKWLKQNEDIIRQGIMIGHEHSDLLKLYCQSVGEFLTEISSIEVERVDESSAQIIEVEF